MLNCRKNVERLDAYIDGRLSWRQRLRAALHLLLCGNCRRFARSLRALVRLAGRRRSSEADAEFVERTVARIRESLK